MKGKRLSYEEIVKLPHETKVWDETDGEDSTVCLINQEKKFISFNEKDIDRFGWDFGTIRDSKRINIYEWIEDNQDTKETEQSKAYKGSEILQMIEDCVLKDEDAIISTITNEEYSVKDICDDKMPSGVIIYAQPFTIKQKPEDYITAVNSGKNIRPVSLNQEKSFHSYTYWLGYMVSSIAHKGNPLDLINGLWEIEQ